MKDEIKTLVCSKCHKEFEPAYRNGILVSRICFTCLAKKAMSRQRHQWRKEKKVLKDGLKTHSRWLKDLQTVFNRYIRMRDMNKPCISCGRILTGKYDAGHFFSVGAYPNLRFNEDNCHGQCVHCNQHKHGNVHEYTVRLPMRIGSQRLEELMKQRNEPLKLTIPQIKDLIDHYKQLIKSIQL